VEPTGLCYCARIRRREIDETFRGAANIDVVPARHIHQFVERCVAAVSAALDQDVLRRGQYVTFGALLS
jgi:hypothetical protein